MAVVRLDNIVKRYDSAHPPAVDDISLTIQDGEFMVLLGPSGCGKSTTLRMVAGLEPITEGRLTIDDALMNAVPAKDRDIAMVFQSYALYPHMTVRGNMAFGLRRRRMPKREVARRVTDTADMLGLTDLLDRKPHALSGGQRQRVALGRAIVRDPKVFLLDEPLSNLDASLRVRTRGELIKLYRRLGATMIYVTHDQIEALTMGSRICVMNEGRIAQVGEPLDVYNNPADTFVASFIGSPATNLLEAPLLAGDDAVSVRVGEASIPVPGYRPADVDGRDRAIFGIRPEDIYLTRPAGDGRFGELPVEVTTVEPLGSETILTLACAGVGEEIRARVERAAQARPGDRMTVFLDLDAAHLFDPATTKVVTRSGAVAADAGGTPLGRTG